jgi:peptidoglycan/xylan/chitin deacetylase (PgdA/CDA1 family)
MTEATAIVARTLGVAEDRVRERVAQETLEGLSRRLLPRAPGAPVRFLRRFAGTALPKVPYSVRRSATSVAKRLRQAIRGEDTWRVADLPFVELGRQLEPVTRTSAGRTEISHDVDWPTCYAYVEKLAALEQERGVRSTFLFLAQDGYTVDRALVQDLAARGFGIGVHGWTHDVAIGWRDPVSVREGLARAREALGVEAKIYRAPGLGASERLFQVLEELGFEVDGSLTVRGTGTIFPYEVPGRRLREHPLALQDDQLFRDRRLDDQGAFQAARALLDEVLAARGSFVFNGHPTLLKEHPRFYEELLDHAKARGPVVPFGTPLA